MTAYDFGLSTVAQTTFESPLDFADRQMKKKTKKPEYSKYELKKMLQKQGKFSETSPKKMVASND